MTRPTFEGYLWQVEVMGYPDVGAAPRRTELRVSRIFWFVSSKASDRYEGQPVIFVPEIAIVGLPSKTAIALRELETMPTEPIIKMEGSYWRYIGPVL